MTKCPECGGKEFICHSEVHLKIHLHAKRGSGMTVTKYEATNEPTGVTYHVECANPECEAEFEGGADWTGRPGSDEYEEAVDAANALNWPVLVQEYPLSQRDVAQRCEATGQAHEVIGSSRIIDCPKCERPVTVRENGTITPHRSDRTKNTDAADERLRQLREFEIR